MGDVILPGDKVSRRQAWRLASNRLVERAEKRWRTTADGWTVEG